MMKVDKKRTLRKYKCFCCGFSLVELMVCIALISILAVAVGLATHRSFQHTGRTKSTLNDLQRRSYLVERMAEKIQWATEISVLESDSITFKFPNPQTGNLVPLSYTWDSVNYELLHQRGIEPPRVLEENIRDFVLQADVIDVDGNILVHGIDLTIQVGPDQNETLTRYIGLPNMPVAPGG